ncbi:MAG: hypothetical protein J5528_05945, partial [Firmicutes bacterium]|nr:hypothetical protein [Bacillota bacterium]
FGESDEYQKLYRPLFETMLAARQQLSEDEICSVLCISPEELKMRLRKLRSYVFEMNQGDDVVLQLFHKSFLEWLSSESAGIYRVSMANGNRLFRDYIFRLMEEGAEFTPYLVRFSLDHFSMEEWDDIEEIDKSSVLDRMLKGAGTYGFLDLEKKYLKVYDDELGRDFCYYMHLLEYYKKTSGVQLKIAVDEALEYIKEHGGDEQQSFDLVSQAAYAYFYAGQEEKSYDLILAEREKHSDDFWTKGINDANYWHVVALTAHDLDNNLEVVKAAGNDVKDYKKQKRYYDLFCSMVNLFDGYMALGDVQRADEIAEDVMTRIEDRYYIHADDIVKICYANLLQTEGRIMESLDYYESGLKIASQIHDWDYLYGSIWRELAVARFGDRSCFAALEKYRKRAEENSYRYLMSLADCFTILSAYLLGDIEKLGDDKIYSRLKEYAFPGHLLQAYCCRVLAGKEKLDPEYLLSLTEKCEGVKGEPTVVRSVLDKYEKDLREAQKYELTEWCNNYVSSILSYREAFEENLVQGLPEEPMLTASACGSCQSVCCYDGVYLTKEEEKLITDFVKQNREHFSFLKEPFVVDGDWPGMRSKRKTEMVERDDYDESFPCHFTKTRCVFELSDGQCSLQRLATDLQLHPWRIKPAACWRFPIRDPKDGSIEPPVTNKDKDPDYVDENYPGYVSFLPCVKSDEEGISWIRKYRNEIEYMRYLEKKGK